MNLPYDEDKAVRVLRRDGRMAEVIDSHGSPRLELREGTVFEALLRSIVYQQLSGRAAATIYGRVTERFGATPTAAAVQRASLEELRALGLSRPKAKAAQDLAAKVLDGTVPPMEDLRRMSDEDVIIQLTSVWGVGTWTAQMLLLFYLGRPDVLPATDLGVRRGLQVCHGLEEMPTPGDAERRAEVWRPYRSLASWYLWRVADAAP